MIKYHTIIGIDPGKSGGIAKLDVLSGQIYHLCKIPIVKASTDKDKDEIDIDGCINTFQLHQDDTGVLVIIEKVQGRHGDAAFKAFGFGHTCGILHTAVRANKLNFILVHPKTWIKELGIVRVTGSNNTEWKNQLKAYISKLHPEQNWSLWSSDAGLLARYGYQKYCK